MADLDSPRPPKRPRLSPDPEEPEISQRSEMLLTIVEDDLEEDAYDPPGEAKASDLYLDTASTMLQFVCLLILKIEQINRAALDFDFEKLCSVSLSNINIYGCLVCGKYFQGRGRKSYAYAHSIHGDHHVFINLESTRVGRDDNATSGSYVFLGLRPPRRISCF